MNNRAIVEKRDALSKATASGESASVIVGILNELKRGVVAKEETLRATKIGASVARLKPHKNAEVAKLASEIVRKWRDEVGGQRGGANGKKGISSPSSTTSPAASQITAKAGSGGLVPPDQRTWKKDKIDVQRTGQTSRNNCIGLLYDGLVHLSSTPAAEVLDVALAVEAAIYKEFGPEERDTYKTKIRSLFQNLKNKSNPNLRVRVVSGEIKPERFVKMNHDELKSQERREEDKAIEKENMNKALAPQAEKSISESLVCGKCKQKAVSYSQAQTRSADEPMTTFCTCMNCGKRWKFS